MRVRATKLGFAGKGTSGTRIRPGKEFTIPDEPKRHLKPTDSAEVRAVADKKGMVPGALSSDWMVPVRPGAPAVEEKSKDSANDGKAPAGLEVI
jgi:hypothetical protein